MIPDDGGKARAEGPAGVVEVDMVGQEAARLGRVGGAGAARGEMADEVAQRLLLAGEAGALKRYGTGKRAGFDRGRV